MGCGYDVWTWPECDLDPEACSDYNGWHLFEGCGGGAPLQVQIGHGDAAFQPFEAGDTATVYNASGGQGSVTHHVLAGVRIANPTPGHARFLVRLQACPGFSSYGSQTVPLPGVPTCSGDITERDAILEASLLHEADGALSRGGLRVFVQRSPTWLAVQVEDECGRTGAAVQAF